LHDRERRLIVLLRGDALSCSFVVFTSNESFKTLFVELKSNALICHFRVVLVSERVGSSEYPCSVGGKFCNNSTEFLVSAGNKSSRFDVILSYMMYRNIITLANEIIDPTDEIIFHVVQASG